jgi:hypothetical protein
VNQNEILWKGTIIGEVMKIDIVTHCWAKEYPHFASALCYQLSSLLLPTTRFFDLQAVVCYEANDELAVGVVNYFSSKVKLKAIVYPNAVTLGRRSIGRNYAAKNSDADVVWFTDVDHVFAESCWSGLLTLSNKELADPSITMIYPKDIKIHRDHATGDKALENKSHKPFTAFVDKSEFIDKHYNRAIGGVQIVFGDFARRYGYLDGVEQFQIPAKKPFGDFRDDVAYRKFCEQHGKIIGVNLPGVFRLRHSTTTYQPPIT